MEWQGYVPSYFIESLATQKVADDTARVPASGADALVEVLREI
jgi:hypothetical protein